jgi:hypothetical protein
MQIRDLPRVVPLRGETLQGASVEAARPSQPRNQDHDDPARHPERHVAARTGHGDRRLRMLLVKCFILTLYEK